MHCYAMLMTTIIANTMLINIVIVIVILIVWIQVGSQLDQLSQAYDYYYC